MLDRADCADFGCHNSTRLQTKHFLNTLAFTFLSFSGRFVFAMQKHYLFFCERSSSYYLFLHEQDIDFLIMTYTVAAYLVPFGVLTLCIITDDPIRVFYKPLLSPFLFPIIHYILFWDTLFLYEQNFFSSLKREILTEVYSKQKQYINSLPN